MGEVLLIERIGQVSVHRTTGVDMDSPNRTTDMGLTCSTEFRFRVACVLELPHEKAFGSCLACRVVRRRRLENFLDFRACSRIPQILAKVRHCMALPTSVGPPTHEMRLLMDHMANLLSCQWTTWFVHSSVERCLAGWLAG
jgi:hypothetical protein